MISTCLQQAKLASEFKEKTVPQMFPVLQKHVKDGHVIGSDGVSCFVAMLLCMCMPVYCGHQIMRCYYFTTEVVMGGYSGLLFA